MTVQLRTGSSSLIDVLDRVLDKGIVIDAWMRVSLAGVDLVEIEARVVVASIHTYLAQARALYGMTLVSPPVNSASKPRRRLSRRAARIGRGADLHAA